MAHLYYLLSRKEAFKNILFFLKKRETITLSQREGMEFSKFTDFSKTSIGIIKQSQK